MEENWRKSPLLFCLLPTALGFLRKPSGYLYNKDYITYLYSLFREFLVSFDISFRSISITSNTKNLVIGTHILNYLASLNIYFTYFIVIFSVFTIHFYFLFFICLLLISFLYAPLLQFLKYTMLDLVCKFGVAATQFLS